MKSPVIHIAAKEWEIFFLSPIATVLLSAFSLVMGIVTFMTVYDAREATFVLQTVFYTAFIILMFITPFYTMRLLAEEKRSGTIDILLSAPVTEWEITLGKFLGALAFYGLMLAIPVVTLLFISFFGKPDFGVFLSNLIGLILSGAVFISLGLLCSSLTKNQIIAAMLCFGILLFLLLVEWVSGLSQGGLRAFLAGFSLSAHFAGFSKGIFDTADFVYFLSFIAFDLFLVTRVLADRRQS
jgi:ABC-2 type transport system permease protein